MSSGTSPDDAGVDAVTPAALKARIDDGDDVFLLDARSEGDFEEWRIDGDGVEVVNYPYFQLLDGIPADLLDQLPDDRTVTVLCAKGGSSELVADHLQEEGYDVDHLEDGMQGWARIYEATELDAGVDGTLIQYRRPSSGCLAYLLVSDGEAAVFDPLRAFTDRYAADVEAHDATLAYALDTHIHADHISGVRALERETGGATVLPAPAADRGVDYDDEYETVADDDTLTVGAVDIEVVHTPGHTSGMTAYKVGNVLLTGDGLFTESVARPDLEDPEAATDAAETLYETLHERILAQPAETIIASAHFSDAATPNDDGSYTATLGDLVESMDALSMDRSEFVEFIVDGMPPRPANYEAIIATNLGHESPSDAEAFELELGPNNCAASEEALTN